MYLPEVPSRQVNCRYASGDPLSVKLLEDNDLSVPSARVAVGSVKFGDLWIIAENRLVRSALCKQPKREYGPAGQGRDA